MKTMALTVGITLFSAVVVNVGLAEESNTNSAKRNESEDKRQAPVAATVAPVPPPGKSSATASSDELNTALVDGKDYKFLVSALENGRVLIWLGQTAKSKAQDFRVRATGAALQSSQTPEDEALIEIARRRGLRVKDFQEPVQQPKIASRLPQNAGAEFDRTLIVYIAAAAEKIVSVYEEGLHADDLEIRKFCERMLPGAKERLERADQAAAQAGGY